MKKKHFFLLIMLLLLAGVTIYRATSPPPPFLEEDHLLINKTLNQLYFYQGNYPPETYKVASGKTPDLTPEGWFTIINKHKDPGGGEKVQENPFGSRWMGLNIPNHEDGLKYGIHGTNEPESIGTFASGGCIRMENREVEELYQKVKINTPVFIYSEGPVTRRLLALFDNLF